MERDLAICRGFDLEIEDHGILVLTGHFEYEGGSSQGLGYAVNAAFLYRFLAVFGNCALRKVEGKSCWVTHDHSSISKIEPLHKKGGDAFDIPTWQAWVQANEHFSPYELRTGKKPS